MTRKVPNRSANVDVARPSTPGRRERKRQETREKIYRAALRLFSERGFFETTTEQITETADVGQGTFFNYFPSKQHVLIVLSEIQLTKANVAREQALAATLPIKQVLKALMHDIAKEPGQSPALARALLSAIMSNETVRAIVADLLQQGRDTLALIVKEGQKRGEIRKDRKSSEIASAFQRAVVGTLFLWTMHSTDTLDVWLERAFRDFWAGFCATKGQAQ